MSEIFRTRDCVVFFKGDSYAVTISSAMQNGWLGGQAAMWADSSVDEFMVTYSDGLYGGFLLWGSNEPSDQYVSFVQNQTANNYAVLCTGGWLISTSTYERFTYTSRVGGGPLVPISYTSGQRLLFSLRGYWTNEDEWFLSGDPRGANGYFVGSVVQVPSSLNENYIGIQTAI